MNQVSEFQKGSFDERATDHESPPTITGPPKMFEDNESGLPEELWVVTETQVPALPPKPVNNSAFQQYQLHTIEFQSSIVYYKLDMAISMGTYISSIKI